MASYKKLGKNVLSLTIGSFGSKLLSFFFVPFYTAVLTTEEYGTADLITTTVSLLFPFFTFIIYESMMRFAQEKNEDPSQIYSIGMIVWGIGSVVLICVAPLIRFVPALKDYWILLLLYYLTYSINSNIGYFIRGLEKVATYSISGIINTFSTICLNLLFLLVLKKGVEGYLLSFIISNFIATLFMFVSARIYKLKLTVRRLDKSLVKKMMKYSLPLIPNSASWWVSNSSDRYILVFFAGTAANGIYSVAYKIPTIISMVTGIFTTAWRLSAVEEFGTEASKKFYSDVFNMYVTLTAIMLSGLMLVNKPLAHFLYSKDFYQAWIFVPVLLVASVFHAYCDFFGSIYTSSMKTKMVFYSTLIGAISNIVLNLILIPIFGGLGAAVATLISYVLVCVIRMINSRRIMKLYYRKYENLITILLLFVQLIVSVSTLKYEYIYSSIVLILLLIIRKNSVVDVIRLILRRK